MESPMPELRLPRPILPLPLIKSMENDEIAIRLHKVARRLYQEIEKQKKNKKRYHYRQDEICNRTVCWLPFS